MAQTRRRRPRVVAALLASTLVVSCSAGPGSSASGGTGAPSGPAPTGTGPTTPSAQGDLGPRSWSIAVWSEEAQTQIAVTRDLETGSVLQFPEGEQAAAIGFGRVAILRWDLGSTSTTTIRIVDAESGVELQRSEMDGLATGVAMREHDLVFSVQGPGDGGVWSLPRESSTPVALLPAGDLQPGADAVSAGRSVVWSSASSRTVAADLRSTADQLGLDVFVDQDDVSRHIELPEGSNVIGITDTIVLIANEGFIGAASLEDGRLLWRQEVSSVSSYYLTPDGSAVIAAIVPSGEVVPRSVDLLRIELATGDSSQIHTWAASEPFPTLWPELSTGDIALAGLSGGLGESLVVGDWSADGVAINLSDGAVTPTSVAISPTIVP